MNPAPEQVQFSFGLDANYFPAMPDFAMSLDEASIVRELSKPGAIFHRYMKFMVDYAKYLQESVGQVDLESAQGLSAARQLQMRREVILSVKQTWEDMLAQAQVEEKEKQDENGQ